MVAIPVLPNVAAVERGHVGVGGHEGQNVVQPEAGVGRIERVVDGADEVIILIVVNRPAVGLGVVQPRFPQDVAQAEAAGILPQVGRGTVSYTHLTNCS